MSSAETSSTSTVRTRSDESLGKQLWLWYHVLLSSLYIGVLWIQKVGVETALQKAHDFRLIAIEEYGRVIHEFDPYFNYRAAEYLYEHGISKFFKWFDYLSWYPLGRPVGTTIYPGMQMSSYFIKLFVLPDWSVNDICVYVPVWFGVLATITTGLLTYECTIGLYDSPTENKNNQQIPHLDSIFNSIPIVNFIYRKVFVPIRNLFIKYLYILTGSTWGLYLGPIPGVPSSSSKKTPPTSHSPALECAIVASCIMAVVPAHLMRSVGGGYDNESVAIFCMTCTFWTWARSLRESNSIASTVFWGILAGLSYFYMVAAWGGYVFCLNTIGLHASLLVLLGKYTRKVYLAYTIFFLLGTTLAIQVPVVSWTPLKSLEQAGPLLTFCIYQGIEFCQAQIRKIRAKDPTKPVSLRTYISVYFRSFGTAAVVLSVIVYVLWNQGYFGPISSRVRGLFVKHTKTGNPLVDSVAEHQPASANAYEQYLTKQLVTILPFGLAWAALRSFSTGSSFCLVYAAVAYFFSNRMVRLVLLTAPIASLLAGIALGHVWAWCWGAFLDERPTMSSLLETAKAFAGFGTMATTTTVNAEIVEEEEAVAASIVEEKNNNGGGKRKKKRGPEKNGKSNNNSNSKKDVVKDAAKDEEVKEEEKKASSKFSWLYIPFFVDPIPVKILRLLAAIYILQQVRDPIADFFSTSHSMAKAISHPSIIQKGQTKDGNVVVVDDYREAYWWLRDNTPADARIMAWWDYGYQITGIANRTTLADGNTWNHEHIALLGRALTSSLKEGHRIARHLADYVLIWAGGGGDDVAKSPHLRRIANSVYRFLCPKDPTCRNFGITKYGQPTSTMKESLLYQLHQVGLNPNVPGDKNRFRLVFHSKYGKVRIFKVLSVSKESKQWVADPKNRLCDAPGSWFCPGQYPPGLEKILKEKKDFQQLEDFNVGGDDSEYTKQYLENLHNPDKAIRENQKAEKKNKKRLKRLSAEEIEEHNDVWENSELTTLLWTIIDQNDIKGLRDLIAEHPEAPHIRSEDGRGPMWWAHEYGRTNMINLLEKLGVTSDREDVNGLTPLDLSS